MDEKKELIFPSEGDMVSGRYQEIERLIDNIMTQRITSNVGSVGRVVARICDVLRELNYEQNKIQS